MKKAIILILIVSVIVSSASASAPVPYYDTFDTMDDVFTSPARLVEESGVTHFAFDVEAFSGIDLLAYLSNPANLGDYIDSLYGFYRNTDLDFWTDSNYSAFRNIVGFDNAGNIPVRPTNDWPRCMPISTIRLEEGSTRLRRHLLY